MTVWKKGPPPSRGWWPASVNRNTGVFRWWNGRNWSDGVSQDASAESADGIARCRACHSNDQIKWRDRPADWPERSHT